MRTHSSSLLIAGLLAAALTAPAHAKQDDRGHGNGNGNGNGNSHHAQQGNDRGQGANRYDDRDHDRDRDRYDRPYDRIQEDLIRSIFRDNRDLVQRGDSLPPGGVNAAMVSARRSSIAAADARGTCCAASRRIASIATAPIRRMSWS